MLIHQLSGSEHRGVRTRNGTNASFISVSEFIFRLGDSPLSTHETLRPC